VQPATFNATLAITEAINATSPAAVSTLTISVFHISS